MKIRNTIKRSVLNELMLIEEVKRLKSNIVLKVVAFEFLKPEHLHHPLPQLCAMPRHHLLGVTAENDTNSKLTRAVRGGTSHPWKRKKSPMCKGRKP